MKFFTAPTFKLVGPRPDDIFEDPEEAREDLRRRTSIGYKLKRLWGRVKDAWWFFKARYVRRYYLVDCRHDFGSNTRYVGDYADPCALMLFSPFSILVTFVEKEMYQSYVDWDSEDDSFGQKTMKSRKDEIMALYDWWTKGRQEEWEDIYRDLGIVDEEEGPGFKFGKRDPVTGTSEMKLTHSARRHAVWERMHAAEQRDQEMLKRLIDIRECLWT